MATSSGRALTPNTTIRRMAILLPIVLCVYGTFVVVADLLTVPALEGGSIPSPFTVAAWFFLAAHGVGLNLYVESSVYSISMGELQGWSPLFVGLPPLALTFAGYLVARRTHLPTRSRGVREGATLATLYVPFVFVLGLVFRGTERPPTQFVPPDVDPTTLESASIVLSMDVFRALWLAGLVYPVVFGGIGGALAHAERSGAGQLAGAGRAFGHLASVLSVCCRPVVACGRALGASRARAIAGGAAMTAGQVPGFAVTYYLFRTQPSVSVERPYFGPETFPLGGVGFFVLVALVVGTLAWWRYSRREYAGSAQRALGLGWLVGLIVHVIVWETSLVVHTVTGPAGALPSTVDAGSWFLLTYSAGWIASLGAGVVAVLLTEDRTVQYLFRDFVPE